MKLLFAVISYQGDADNGNNQLIRETWGKDIAGADLRFFIGRRSKSFWSEKADEEFVDFQRSRNCHHAWWESYVNCCQDFWQVQVRSMLDWALIRDYDFIYLCSTDTFVVPKLLMKTGFEQYDYSGYFVPEELTLGVRSHWDIYNEKRYAWADVGNGLFLSKRAASLVLREKPNYQYTDQHIAQALGPYVESGLITAGRLPNFRNKIAWHFRDQDGTGYQTHGTGWMKRMYQEHGQDGI